MTHKRLLRALFFTLLSTLFLMPILVLADAQFDLGRINYPNPVVGVTYTAPVMALESSSRLENTDTNDIIYLNFEPSADSDYYLEYEINPDQLQLDNGPYWLSLTAKSVYGLVTPEPNSVAFRVTGLEAKLYEPEGGYSSTTPYAIEITTSYFNPDTGADIPANAICRYFLGDTGSQVWDDYTNEFSPSLIYNDENQCQDSDLGTIHTATGIETSQTVLTVLCRDRRANCDDTNRVAYAQFNIGMDDSAPTINVTVTPPNVYDENNPYAGVGVETDDMSFCEISTEKTSTITVPFALGASSKDNYTAYTNIHGHVISFDNNDGVNRNVQDHEEHNFTYTITCYNRAGLSTTQQIHVGVNLDIGLNIGVIAPRPLTNANPVTANITTNIAATCTIGGEAMTRDSFGRFHVATLVTEAYQNYSLPISCEGYDKNASTTINFTTDRVAPTNVNINTSTYICNGQASAKITAEDNHEMRQFSWRLKQADLIIADGTSASGIVNTSVSASGTYTWEATAEDQAGNTADASPVTVTVAPGNSDDCDPNPFIQYYNPPLGWGTHSFDISIKTKRPAECGYLYYVAGVGDDDDHLPATSNADKTIHTLITSFNDPYRELHILCEEDDNTSHSEILGFGILDADLTINVIQALPNPIIDFSSKKTNINVITSHEAVCSLTDTTTEYFNGENPDLYESYDTTHNLTKTYSEINNFEKHTFNYQLSCTDRAGQTETKALTIIVDFLSAYTIDIISPKNYIKTPSVSLVIKPEVSAVCQYKDPDTGPEGSWHDMTADSKGTHSASIPTSFTEGSHNIQVECLSAAIGNSSNLAQFTVDSKAPSLSITGQDKVCKDNSLKLIINASDNSSGVLHTEIKLTTPNGTIRYRNVTSATYTLHTKNKEIGAYTLNAQALDKAGNKGTSITKTLNVYASTDSICGSLTNTSDCGNMLVDPGEECDGSGLSCTYLGYSSGSATCQSSCQLTLDSCVGFTNGTCGNGIINSAEACDGTNITATCADLGFAGGSISCTSTCRPDTTACTAGTTPTPTCSLNCAADTYCVADCALDSACDPDPDCGGPGPSCSEDCSSDDICNSFCAATTGCSDDPDCAEPEPSCSYSCSEDDACVEGCASDPLCPLDPDCEKGFDWIALILIVLGLFIIGGASYYLYTAYQDRQAVAASLASTAQPGTPGTAASGQAAGAKLSPQERAKMLAALQKRREAELDAFKKHAKAKSDKRHETLEGFGDAAPKQKEEEKPTVSVRGHKLEGFGEVESTPQEAAQKDQAGQKIAGQEIAGQETKENDGEYISLDEIGKKPKKKQTKKTENKKTYSEQDDETFDELDELIDEKK